MSTTTPRGLGYADIKPVLDEVARGSRTVYGERLARLVLYGSYARGEAHAESDVDLLILLHGPVNTPEEIRRANAVIYPIELALSQARRSLRTDAFYLARALLEGQGHIKTHRGLLSAFNLHFIRTDELDKRFGELFNDLFDARQLPDYQDLTPAEIRDVIAQVQEFIRVAEPILATP